MGVGLLRAEGHESWEKGMTFVKGHGICESQRTLGFTIYSVITTIYGHSKSKTWHFEKVNTRRPRNKVMSIVESIGECLQKAWEGLQ